MSFLEQPRAAVENIIGSVSLVAVLGQPRQWQEKETNDTLSALPRHSFILFNLLFKQWYKMRGQN